MWNKKEEKYVHTYLVYKIKSRTKKIPVWREIETIGTACFEKETRNNTQKWKILGRCKISIILIFRLHELGEVHPNYKMENLKGNSLPPLISLVIVELSLKSRICAELNKNYKLVWQFLCSLTDDNLRVTIHSFKCQGVGSTVSH